MSWRIGLLSVAIGWLALETASAQVGIPGIGAYGRGNREQRFQQQLNRMPPLNIQGTVEAVSSGAIKIISDANQPMLLQVPPVAKCTLTGKATRVALNAGCFVRFSAEITKRRGSATVEEPLDKLTVFSPSQTQPLGVDPDLGFGSGSAERPEAVKNKKKVEADVKPAFGAESGTAGTSGRSSSRKASGSGKKTATAVAASEKFEIRGRIASNSNGQIVVQLPSNPHFRGTIRAEIADNADIDVDIDDPLAYTMARKGDKIHVQGRGTGNQGFATHLEITLAEPIGALHEAKKPRAKAERPTRSKRPTESQKTKENLSEPGLDERK